MTAENIIYRRAEKEDYDTLARLRTDFLLENGSIKPEESEKTYSMNRDYFYKALGDKTFEAWLGLYENKIIGTSGAIFYESPPSIANPTGKSSYIMNVYVVPEYRKKGIAEYIVRKLIEDVKKRGVSVIRLRATNKGRPMYEKIGFKSIDCEMELNFE